MRSSLQHDANEHVKVYDVRGNDVKDEHAQLFADYVLEEKDTNLAVMTVHHWVIDQAVDELVQNNHDQVTEMMDELHASYSMNNVQLVVIADSYKTTNGYGGRSWRTQHEFEAYQVLTETNQKMSCVHYDNRTKQLTLVNYNSTLPPSAMIGGLSDKSKTKNKGLRLVGKWGDGLKSASNVLVRREVPDLVQSKGG